MALGRQRERQSDMMVSWTELPRSPGHAFYDRLQAELITAGFDGFVECLCAPLYAARRGRPSLPPGRYFRMLLVGYFEGIDRALVHFDGLNSGKMLFLLFGPDRTDAAQAQRRSPSSHPEDVVQGAELAGV